jgi:hypothetical protein
MTATPARPAGPDVVLIAVVCAGLALEAAVTLAVALVALVVAAATAGRPMPALEPAPAAPALQPVVITPALPPAAPPARVTVADLRRQARVAGIPSARVRRARRDELLTLLAVVV